MFYKISTWIKLLRVCSYMLGFINTLSHKDHENGSLTATELKDGTSKVFQLNDCFSDEVL